ncbi:MAG: class I SAM-dependent methyltransferase, partial [Acidimicrobiia bacterium]
AQGAQGHLRVGSITGLPFWRSNFDLVCVLETLEHLAPETIPRALRELKRVTRGYVLATVPSFGPNPHGPGGWFDVKVRPERLDHYRSLGPSYEGPVPYEDLYRDEAGRPIEGHLTIASFAWWTKRFEEAGFVRCGEVEELIHPDLARFGLTKYWNLYVLRLPSAPSPRPRRLSTEAVSEVERRFALDSRPTDPADFAAVRAALGPSAGLS